MNVAEMQECLNGMFYKPGYGMDIVVSMAGSVYLRLTTSGDMVDSTVYPVDTSKTVRLCSNSPVPKWLYDVDEYTFKYWVLERWIAWETHEAKEWFRSFDDGKPYDDPHKPTGPQRAEHDEVYDNLFGGSNA